MLRTIALALLAAALIAMPAHAEINQKRYANLAKVSCEQQQTIDDMAEIWKSMRFTDGTLVRTVVSRVSITSSATKAKGKNKLRCAVMI
jgi:hypothetical protein